LDPLSNWNVDSSNPEFRFINPLLNTSNNEFSYIFKIFKSPDSLNKPLLSSKDNEITENESFVEWRIGKSLLPERNYWITSQLINKTTGKSSAIQILPFHSANLSLVDSVIYIVSGANLRNSMTVSDLNVNSSGDTVYLKLADTLKSYQVKSARGGTVKNPERKSEIFYDGIYTFTTPPDDLGFKVVRVSGKDFLVKQAKKFDTWGDALYPMSDSNSVKLVEFLKDSVEIGDYVMLATHGESFRLPQIWQANKPESNGSLDSLRAILREYGSVLADSITWGYSFAMVGKKGDKRGSANEMASDSGEGIEISGNINKYGRFGSVVSNRIGPAKKWGRLDITGYFPFEKNALKNYLKIWVSLNGTSAKFLKYQIDSIANINLDTIANGYPYLWIETGFGRESENIDPYFTALKCGFIPTEEFTLVKSQTGLKADTVMRGDSVGLSFTARNISKRVSSDSNTIMVRLGTKTGEVEKLLIPQKILNSDEIGSHFIYLVTDNYNSSNELVLNVNPEEKPEELYSFNNQFSSKLDVTKDSVKPHIKLYFDSIEVHNGDYVAKQPNIKIDILDNSQLPISSINKVEVYINGRWQDPSKMNFKSFGRDIPLKATVKFLSDSLEFGDNIIRIYSSDATGNRDTLIVAVYVSLNWFIVNTDIYPNPMMEQSRIEFVLKAPRNEGMTQVTFFNLEGQKIRTLKQPSTIGKNSIAWDGKDEWGNSIPTGLYSYLVQVLTEDYIEPVKKKLVIIR